MKYKNMLMQPFTPGRGIEDWRWEKAFGPIKYPGISKDNYYENVGKKLNKRVITGKGNIVIPLSIKIKNVDN